MCMKSTLVIVLCLFSSLYGLYNGNPSFPELPEKGLWIREDAWYGFKVGYQGDYVFDRRMEVENKQSSIRKRVEELQFFKNQGELVFNILNRFECYAGLGGMKAKLCQDPVKGVRLDVHTSTGFSIEAGARVMMITWKELVLGADGKYLYSNLPVDRFKQNGLERKSGGDLHYDEWQVGVGLSRRFGFFIPYAGVSYAVAHAELRNIPSDDRFSFTPESEDLENRDKFNLLIGAGISTWNTLVFNLELRIIGEIALGGSLDFRF